MTTCTGPFLPKDGQGTVRAKVTIDKSVTHRTGEQIPVGARIIAVADAYDTITSDRTYKKARTTAEALAELQRCANAQFDAKVVEAFVRMMKSMPNPIIEVASVTRNS